MVSIIMSVYNVEKYLDQCLDSIFNQTYTEFELIIINDGSIDRSIDIINDYMKKFDNIIYIEQKNKGLSVARNLGLTASKGEYILYVDSDDYLNPQMIQLMVEKIKVDDSDMVIVGHREFYDDSESKDIEVFLNIKEKQIYSGIEVANMMLDCKIMGVAWNKLYKRKKLIDDKFMFEPERYTQDWYPTFKHISNLKKISFVNQPLYNYRLRSTSTTSLKNPKRLNDYYHAVQSILNYTQECNLPLSLKSINRFEIKTFINIIFMYYHLNKDDANIYSKFKLEGYNTFNISIKKIIHNGSVRNLIYFIAWKLQFFKKIREIEIFLRKYIT